MGTLAAAEPGREHSARACDSGTDVIPRDGPGLPAMAATTAEALAIWRELLDAFHDRRAALRLVRDTNLRAGHRWRPRIALVLPRDFSTERPSHRRDLAVALEVLAATVEQYNVEVVSDSPSAPRLFEPVRPYSAGAIARCTGALVVGSRSLNDEVAATRPSRYVAADPIAFRDEARRIVFEAAQIAWPFEPADEREVASAIGHGASAFLDDGDEVPSYLEALRRVAGASPGFRVSLSARSDAESGRRAREAMADIPHAEVVGPPSPGDDGAFGFVVANEPLALLTRRDPRRPAFLFRDGRFLRVEAEGLSRPDLYLHRGEEADVASLLGRWLDPTAVEDAASPRAARPGGMVEPMVSIVVPVYDRTTELIRLAASVFEQEHPWVEVLFVCNGSPTETREAVRAAEAHLMKRRFRVRIIEMPRACGSATIPRDVGIRAAVGDLVCVLDSDDWLDPGFFDFLTHGGSPWRDDTIYYPHKVFRDFGRPMRDDFPWDSPMAGPGTVEASAMPGALRSLGNFLCNSGVCFSRALFHRAGGIDHRLHYGEDLYLWWRLALAGARAQMHDGRVNIALHPGNNELVVGEDRRAAEAVALACGRGRSPWL